MKTTTKLEGNTILITGGSSGVGLELARVLIKKGNKVLICGRSEEKLQKAKLANPQVHTFPCDLAKQAEREKLHSWVINNYPECNILINNAAIVNRFNFRHEDDLLTKLEHEMQVNFIAPLMLTKLFLSQLEKQRNSSLINITTGLAYVPKAIQPIYCASKAALHSFTQSLRYQWAELPIKVVEVLLPAINTPFHQGNIPKIAISPEAAVAEMIYEMEKNKEEIKVGKVKLAYLLSRIAPAFAMKKINQL